MDSFKRMSSYHSAYYESSTPFLSTDTATYPRLIGRDSAFHQASGNMSIKKKIKRHHWRSLYSLDLFHSLVDSPFHRIIIILITGYMLIISVFAIFYLLVSLNYGCGLDISTYGEAWVFSLETMATIGYGTPDIFFDDCSAPVVILASQVCVKLISDAMVIGVIYCRLSSPYSRASTIIFSSKAIIRRIRGKLYLMFQLCELRKKQLVNAQIRLYLVRREIDVGEKLGEASQFSNSKLEPPKSFIQTCSMRLNHPNDELGSMMLLYLPQVIVHEIDAWSPLMPPPAWVSAETGQLVRWRPPAYRFAEKSSHQKSSRQEGEGRPFSARRSNTSAFEGPSYDEDALSALFFPSISSRTPLKKRGKGSPGLKEFMDIMSCSKGRSISTEEAEREEGGAGDAGVDGENEDEFYEAGPPTNETNTQMEERLMMERYIMDRRVEIIALLEGVDSATGGVVQVLLMLLFRLLKYWRVKLTLILSKLTSTSKRSLSTA